MSPRCQHGEHMYDYDESTGKVHGMQCRKRGRVVIETREQFGTRVTGQGDEPVYIRRLEWRCIGHTNSEEGA